MAWLILTSILFTLSSSDAANILGVFCVNSKSHHSINQPIVKALAARGHNVTIVSHFASKSAQSNYTEILLDEGLPSFVDTFAIDDAYKLKGFVTSLFTGRIVEEMSCDQFMKSTFAQHIIKSKEKLFDLIMTEMYFSQCFNLLAHVLDVPVIAVLPPSISVGLDIMIGNPGSPAYMPMVTSSYTSKMDFYQRVINTIQYAVLYFGHYTFLNGFMNRISKDFFDMDLPPLDELHRRVAAVFYNNHLSFIGRPTAPNAINIAGIHIQEPSPLPKDIQEFIDGAKDGVIFFSFGTTIKASSIHPKQLQALKEVFSTIPQRVIWRTNELNITDLSDNVKLGHWFPQRDILEHQNVRAFISHCGLFGTLEAIYTATPVIGIPFLFDQFQDAKILVERGVAVLVDYYTMDKNVLLKAINQVLYDKKYQDNMQKLSKIFKDRPMSPLDTAIYWTEYVIRHKGAPHLRVAGADMPLYQYLLLDVVTFILVLVGCALYLFKFMISKIISYFFKDKMKYKKT